jgi:alcohol dehydrogenase
MVRFKPQRDPTRRNTMSLPTIIENTHRFCNPVKIISGIRALEHLPVELASFDAIRPMVVAPQKQGLGSRLRRLLKAFRDSGMTLVVYDRLPVEADLEQIRSVAGYFQEAGCDALLVLGEGRLLHRVKALRLFIQSVLPERSMAASGETASQNGAAKHSDANNSAGNNSAGLPDLLPHEHEAAARIPLFWLPTGPGAGDELGGVIEIAGQTRTHPSLRPQLACMDKRLLKSGDSRRRHRERLLDSVLIALVNAVEVCLLRGDNPFAAAYAEAAIRTIVDTLTPEGLEASGPDILLALTNAALWTDCGRDMQPPGLAHRLGRALAARTEMGAGLFMALCLPAVVDRALAGRRRLTAELLHLLGGAQLYSLTEAKLRRPRCVNLLREGWHTLCEFWPAELPFDLQATGIAREALPEVAREADPVDPQAALEILERSWTLVPGLRLQARPQASTAAADSQNTPPTAPHADRGAQDAPAELL